MLGGISRARRGGATNAPSSRSAFCWLGQDRGEARHSGHQTRSSRKSPKHRKASLPPRGWEVRLLAAAAAGARLVEIQAELADLERRLGRQLLNLEAEERTPALRKRIAIRVAGLEDTIADRQQRARELAEQADSEAPTLADVAPLLHRLPHSGLRAH
jgi:hypothetical protein